MNMRRCFYSVLSVCLSLFVLFSSSHIVLASDNLDSGVSTYNLTNNDLDNGALVLDFNKNFVSNQSLKDFISPVSYKNGIVATGSLETNFLYFYNSFQVQDLFYLHKSGYSKMFSKGSSVDISISNILNVLVSSSYDVYDFVENKAGSIEVYVCDKNLSYTRIYPNQFNIVHSEIFAVGHYDFHFSFDSLPQDVYGLQIRLNYNMDAFPTASSIYGTNVGMRWDAGFDETVISFDEKLEDKSEGLLGSITQIVNNIKDGILNLPSTIANAISGFFENVVSAVSNLPQALKGFFDNIVNGISSMANALKDKLSEVITGITSKLQVVLDGIKNALTTLGNFLIDGIKGLFVPTEEDIANIKDDWENLLATRFGALYEVVQLCIDYAYSFNSAASVSVASGGSSVITIPVVSIPLGSVNFDFGGWEVDIVPNGFEFLVNALKTMLSVCATVLFVNGLRNKFERLVAK